MIELRAQQIIIDAPRADAEPFIAIVVQRLVHDDSGAIVQTINREKMINRVLSKVATDLYAYVDPVTQSYVNISGAGLGSAITVAARQWILEEYSEAQLIDGRVILDGNN